MLQFVPRTTMAFKTEPLQGLPMWLSKLLYMRGIDTDEKARQFLHPSLGDLYDPFAMKGMSEATAIIHEALMQNRRVAVYGDYDVDGICAVTIMVRTLRLMGANVTPYLPNRHSEGYGLNSDAVKTLADNHQLLITVDCGITNHDEVALAQSLGMKVIVTDHHEPAPTPSPADALLNPLLGYPFGRLCGAGVALKLCQALRGPDAILPLLPLCALATVADIVPLIDENRILVKHGLDMMASTDIPGLNALIHAAGLQDAICASDLGFKLAPRLNAAGRLGSAEMGLKLLLTNDAAEAADLANALNEENEQRRHAQDAMLKTALALLPEQVDFKRDKAIIIVGDDFNPGIIGLCAGKLCEMYHYPAIVLSRREDGTLVGSARSIPGVNIHQALSQLKDLFVRFGGHAQAAGLTMEEGFLPEMRRRLSLAISDLADPMCYVENKEYDLPMTFDETSEAMVNALQALEPTGYGNPSPVFLTKDASVQRMRAVGNGGAHLSMTLLDGQTLLNGIFFSKGDMAKLAPARVDVLYTPKINVWQGQTTVQLMVSALVPAQGATAVSENADFGKALLQDLNAIATNTIKISLCEMPVIVPITTAKVTALLKGVQGTLVIARTKQTALRFNHVPNVCLYECRDPRGFHTLLCCPKTDALRDDYTSIVLADGVLSSAEIALLHSRCPSATLYALKRSKPLNELLCSLNLTDDALRQVYKLLVNRQGAAISAIAAELSLTDAQMYLALKVFEELNLLRLTESPYAFALLPSKKCNLTDSSWLMAVRNTAVTH